MREQDEITPAEQELTAALRSLAPADAQMDGLAIAFEAGRRRERRRVRQWQSITGAIALLSCAMIGFAMKPLEMKPDRPEISSAVAPQVTVPTRADARWTVFPISWSEFFTEAAAGELDRNGLLTGHDRKNDLAAQWTDAKFFDSAETLKLTDSMELVGGIGIPQPRPWLIVGQPMGYAYPQTP